MVLEPMQMAFVFKGVTLVLLVFRQIGIPGATGLGLDMGETGAGGRIGNANEVLAGGALDLAPRVAGITGQRLIAVGAIEFEFRCFHTAL